MAAKHRVPDHLRPETRKWVKGILAEYELESHHFRQLVKTSEAWDRSEQAREILAKDGLTVVDRYGTPKAHPCVGIERDSRTAFFRGLRELALDGVDAPDAPRPPRTADYGARR
ncbi:hypothetical protein [Rhizobium binae]|uniref:hypothetical protein n=1 Tax=Rhizobium binae TaxID=1138190 RepID=UPI001C83A21A|nr:hypothetical protein [Rhizobium binae]MBX4967192.1 hypothetical protein [Rhizobium binae]